MKKMKLLLFVCCLMGSFLALAASPKDSVIVKIDTRNQEVIGASKKGQSLRDEVARILEQKGIVLTDSIWQQVRTAIRKEEEAPQRLEFTLNDQKIVIGLVRPSESVRKYASSPRSEGDREPLSLKEQVKISLKEGIHVKDGDEEVLIDRNGIRVNDGVEETKIIWGSSDEKKKEGTRFYERKGFNLNLGLNNWSGELGGPVGITIYPAPLLGSDKVLNTLGSRYVAMEWMRYATLSKGKKSSFRLGYGLGIEWYNMMFDHNRVLQNNANAIAFAPMANQMGNEVTFSKNKLAATYVTLPIMPHWSFNEKSAIQMIAFGGYVSYRLDSWVKTKEKGSGDKNHYSGNYLLNDIRMGGRIEVSLRNFPDLFFNMDMTPMFQQGNGSTVQLYSFGFKLL